MSGRRFWSAPAAASGIAHRRARSACWAALPMAIAIFARPPTLQRLTLWRRAKPASLYGYMKCTRWMVSASRRLPAGSTPRVFRRATGTRVGNARLSGRCCAITTPYATAGHERPREEWIEIPVPALVTEETFARVEELLQENRIRSRRRTIAPSVVQGLVSCAKCGYAFARTSTQTSARKIHYYKCIGSDGWRKLGGPVCDNNQFMRQDLLDRIVWSEVVRLLEDPALIQQELDRRLVAARSSDPTKKREQSLQRELTQAGKGIERLLNAYQEGLLSIDQLRERMPLLRQRERAIR